MTVTVAAEFSAIVVQLGTTTLAATWDERADPQG
jgi:hypothetical protein